MIQYDSRGPQKRGGWPVVHHTFGNPDPVHMAVPWVHVSFIGIERLAPRMRTILRGFMYDERHSGWETFEGAYNQCDDASPVFYTYLEHLGVRSRMRQYVMRGGKGTDRPLCPMGTVRNPIPHFIEPDYNFHVVNVVGRLVIDWTARQFDESLPYPAIWRDERP